MAKSLTETRQKRQLRDEIRHDTMEQLDDFRQTILSLSDQTRIDGALDTIEFYAKQLPVLTGADEMADWSSRAIADVRLDLAIAEFGWGSVETEAIYEAEKRAVRSLYNDDAGSC